MLLNQISSLPRIKNPVDGVMLSDKLGEVANTIRAEDVAGGKIF